MGSLFNKIICLLIVCAVCVGGATINAVASQTSTNILFIGNSLTYYYDMPDMLYHLAGNSDKKVCVDSVTESGTTMYRCASEETDIGQRVNTMLSSKTYDYIIIQPSRRITSYESTVLEAETAAAIHFNIIANTMGAKTLVYATPGLNTGLLNVYSMDESGTNSTLIQTYPITRKEHFRFAKQTAEKICSKLINAEVVYAGDAVEEAIANGFSGNMYSSDNRHPSRICSYLFACCFFDKIFENVSGNSFIGSSYAENAAFMQKIADIAILSADISTLDYNTYSRSFSYCYLSEKKKVHLSWNERYKVQGYEIYRKKYGENYILIASLPANFHSYTDTVPQAEKYYYKFRAILKTGNLEFNSTYSPQLSVSALGELTLKDVSLVNKTSAKISYSSAFGAAGYKIYRKASGGSYSLIATTSKLSYIDTKLKTGKTYFYKVKAYKKSGGKKIYSSYTAEQSISALSAPKVTLKAYKKAVRVSFEKSAGATGYMVYAKKGKNGKYSLVKVTSNNAVMVKSLVSGSMYYFKVKAFKIVGNNVNYSKSFSAVSAKVL